MNRTPTNMFNAAVLGSKRRRKAKRSSHRVSASALILTMLVIAALMTLSLGMARIVPRDYRDILSFESSLSAEHAAWSGVEQSLYLIRDKEQQNQFYEETGDTGIPYGAYTTGGITSPDCIGIRTACPAFDRGVDLPQKQSPKLETDINGVPLLATPDLNYALTVFHKHTDVGNPRDTTLDDGIIPATGLAGTDTLLESSKYTTNINPVLTRDEVRRLDVQGVDSVRIHWKPIQIPSNNSYGFAPCDTASNNATFYLVTSIYDNNNNLVNRFVTPKNGPLTTGLSWGTDSAVTGAPGIIPLAGTSYIMSLRFLVSTNQVDDSSIKGCFIRYSIKNNDQTQSTDLGFDVITSIGMSGHVQRKIQVKANRENGRPLSIFDFGIVCQQCDNIN